MTDKAAIILDKVCKYYHRGSETVHAVQNVSLTINNGEYVAIVGHSGSGKTTLLNLMGCLDRPSKGDVSITGNRTANRSEKELTEIRKNSIGFIFQQFFLIPTLTVLQNVQLPALFAKNPQDKKAADYLEMVGLGKRLKHLPSQLSGGEMQRVAIARSLINDPPILLADEPTGNLDSHNAETIMNLFEKLNNQGKTIVVVTHNRDLVKRCSRAVHIEDGNIKEN